jgi:hypothetical protein
MFNFSNQEPMEDKTPPPQGNRGPKFDVNGKEIPISLGLSNLWKLAVDHPESEVLPCLHRAPKEKPNQKRLMLIC